MNSQLHNTLRLSPTLPIALLLGLFLLPACATPTTDAVAEKEYNKQDKLILAKEDFERRRQECENNLGVMTIPRYSSTSRGEHTATEYKMAQCQTRR